MKVCCKNEWGCVRPGCVYRSGLCRWHLPAGRITVTADSSSRGIRWRGCCNRVGGKLGQNKGPSSGNSPARHRDIGCVWASGCSCWRIRLPRCTNSLFSSQLLRHSPPQCDWSRPVGRPYTSWMATLKSDLSLHNITFEDAIELALDKSLWRLLVASGATHWHGACWIMMMMMMNKDTRQIKLSS